MSNIKLLLTENKASPYRKQRVVGRLGDGGLTTIDVELLKSDGKTPYSVFSNQNLIFVGTNSKGEYTDGVPEIVDGQKGIIRYTFTKGNFSVLKEFKRAYFQLTDADGSRVTFQDFTVDVLKNSDIDQGQVTLYVRLLDQLLSDFERRFGEQSIDFEERFKVFLQAKETQYQNIYQMYNDLVLKLENLSNDTKSLQEMQVEILKSIEEHDVFTKQESSANVIDQIIGKETSKNNFNIDYSGKISGSIVENYNVVKVAAGTKLTNPSNFTGEINQSNYSKLMTLDDQVYPAPSKVNGAQIQVLFRYDLLNIFTKRYGELFWTIQGIEETSEKVALLKRIVTYINASVWGFGSSPLGNKIYTTWWVESAGVWGGTTKTNTTNKIVKMSLGTAQTTVIDSTGCLNILCYADPSDGNIASTVNIDYANLEFTVDVSANELIRSMIAAYHGNNIATQEEAELGEDEKKIMSPLRVFQAIAKWTKDKFVSKTENETVLGVKNFDNGLQVGGRNVLSHEGEKRFVTNSTNNSSIESGSIIFKRYGDDVEVFMNFQVRASGDLTRDMNIVAETIVDSIYEPAENFSFFVGNEAAQAVVKFVGKAIKAHSTLTKGIWYVGTTSYKAKNKL